MRKTWDLSLWYERMISWKEEILLLLDSTLKWKKIFCVHFNCLKEFSPRQFLFVYRNSVLYLSISLQLHVPVYYITYRTQNSFINCLYIHVPEIVSISIQSLSVYLKNFWSLKPYHSYCSGRLSSFLFFYNLLRYGTLSNSETLKFLVEYTFIKDV